MIWAWIGAILVGLTLGLLGSGGSILTVPVLVYLVGRPDKLAIAESLGIVFLISLVGAAQFAARRQVAWRRTLYFGVPGMTGSYIGASLSRFVSGPVQLVLFASVMLLAANVMFRSSRRHALRRPPEEDPPWLMASEGFLVGLFTGFIGVGGGFLIVPALVLLGGLPIRLAIGTSLSIIALNSLTGFYQHTRLLAASGTTVDWHLILLFGALGIIGSFAGRRLGRYIPQPTLQRGFAVFLVLVSLFILIQRAPMFLH